MAEYNAPGSLITPAGTVTFNDSSPAGFLHDASSCSGLDMAPARVTVDDKPGGGGIVHKGYLGPRHVILGGTLWAATADARQTLEDGLVAALESIFAVDGTYQWIITTETTTFTRSITVRCELGLGTSGPFQKTYTFGLVAADPTIVEDGSPVSGSGGSNPGGGGSGPTNLEADFEIS